MAKEYLKLALRYRSEYFRHILAVTFTNKSTQEMKDRILAYLYDFAHGRPNPLADELKSELGLDDATFRNHAQELLAAILHGYAQFSISTIDAFFQKVIRSFTREAGLVGDYRLEVETGLVMEEVIDRLMDELGSNPTLTQWLVDFANESLENDRAWDVRGDLIRFAQEIFNEDFKAIEDEFLTVTSGKDFFNNLITELRKKRDGLTNFLRSRGKEGMKEIETNGLTDEDFKYTKSGAINFFRKMANLESLSRFEIGVRVTGEFTNAENWPNKKSAKAAVVKLLAENKLVRLMQESVEYYQNHIQEALSANVVLKNFYAFGLLSDISRKLREYKEEHSMMLLADAPKFLNGLIGETDTPFIYEKVGSFYKNFLIDEFQDTSSMQWKNFLPLVENSLSQGQGCTIVGDVKQAIYRWRGGDLGLLQSQLEQDIKPHPADTFELNRNFRSASGIVEFNNALFQSLTSIVGSRINTTLAQEVYRDVEQKVFQEHTGLVKVKFLEETDDVSWRERALIELTKSLEYLQQQSVAVSDIAILVRRKEEGQQIVAHLLHYKNSPEARTDCRYDVISSESLLLEGASSVNLLLGALRYLANPDNVIARAQLAYEFSRMHEPDRILTEVFAVANQITFETNLPEAFTNAKLSLRKLPLFELTETLIEIFNLGSVVGELAYLQAFQDVIQEFSSRERNDINAFLEWWELNRDKKSIQVPDQVQAAQILTIHKSKGLQFKYVLIPFCSWTMEHEPFNSPTLWVKSGEGVFKNAGYVPVKYSSTLEETYFSSDYEQERTKSYLDNLNLLYVALTRAEKGMIVFAPDKDVRNVKNTIASLLYEGINSSLTLLNGWDATTKEWTQGEVKIQNHMKVVSSSSLSLLKYPSHTWREKLVIRHSGSDYFKQEQVTESEQRRTLGIHLHHIFSRIRYMPDVERVLNDITNEGWFISGDLPQVREMLQQAFSVPQIAAWFSNEWEVRTEVPILLPGGQENRIDRLIIKGTQAIVIDYKSGEAKASDQKQVKEYMEILRGMNFQPVEGHILYLKTLEVVSIPPGKVKATRKKSDGQLGLDF